MKILIVSANSIQPKVNIKPIILKHFRVPPTLILILTGRVADFRNTVIIMTSNLGQQELQDYKIEKEKQRLISSESGQSDSLSDGYTAQDEEDLERLTLDIVNRYFSPEFVNRIDEVIRFKSLDVSAVKNVCTLQLDRVRGLLHSRGIELTVTPDAENWLAETGFSANFGARPLKRLIQARVLDPLAMMILEVKQMMLKPSS